MAAEIYYGKSNVSVYRTYATPLKGLTAIPESGFTERSNNLLAVDVDVRVFGNAFLPAYTEGDNSMVVATDTMKNFILEESVNYTGATIEGLLEMLGQRFLSTYSNMEWVRMTGREIPFVSASSNDNLYSMGNSDYTTATLDIKRNGAGFVVSDHQCGRVGFKLVKLTGSAFAGFDRDRYTTLEERPDRLLYIFMDMYWKYADPAVMLDPQHSGYVAAEQIRDLACYTFNDFVSMSIQHLMYEIGTRTLERFPQLIEVGFDGQNRTWDLGFTSAQDKKVRSYCDPRPPYGSLGLVLRRD